MSFLVPLQDFGSRVNTGDEVRGFSLAEGEVEDDRSKARRRQRKSEGSLLSGIDRGHTKDVSRTGY